MKISELLKSSALSRNMQIPVAIAGENRSVTLGQLIDTLDASVVLFARIDDKAYTYGQITTAPATVKWPVVYRPFDKKFYGLSVVVSQVSGVTQERAVFYQDFIGKEQFYDDYGAIRADCLFLSDDSRLYRYDTGAHDLVSAGITDAQAKQLQLLTPQEVASETELQAMEEAGLIVPGQVYYIPEND